MNIAFHRVLPTLVILTAVAFHAFTIRHGHDWGGDFSLYIAHARNMVEGIPYAETGYIFNPQFSYLSPATYPPVFPFLLTPVYAIFGLNLYVFKVYILLLFIVFLFFYFQHSSDRLSSEWSRIGALAAVGFSPWFWDLKNSVWSDIPFVLFLYAALILLDRMHRIEHWGRGPLLLSLAAGLTIYLAYGTRSVGLLLIPALIAKDLFHFRAIKRTSIITTLTFAMSYFLQSAFLHSDKTYGNTLQLLNSQIISSNLEKYINLIANYWVNPIGGLPQIAIIALTLSLGIFGFVWTLRHRCSSAEFFLVLYIGILIFWPGFQGSRYLLPIIPLAILYLFIGIEKLPWASFSSYKPALTAIMIALIGLFHLGSYSERDFSDYSFGVEKKETQEMFDFVRSKVPQESVFIFRKPRVLALFTGKRSSCYHKVDDPEQLWKYFNQIQATHVIVRKPGRSAEENLREEPWFLETVQHYGDELNIVFDNADFYVYEIRNRHE